MQLFLPACKLAMPKASLPRQSLILLMVAQNKIFLQNQLSRTSQENGNIYQITKTYTRKVKGNKPLHKLWMSKKEK